MYKKKSLSLSTDEPYRAEYSKVHDTIEDMNDKLTDMFFKKEMAVVQDFEMRLKEAQKLLNHLKNLNNEEGLRKRLSDKKEVLETEKKQFLELSMYFSAKCEVFKEKLYKVSHENRDLEDEIKYLKMSINSFQKKIRNHSQDKLKTQTIEKEEDTKQSMDSLKGTIKNRGYKQMSVGSPKSIQIEIPLEEENIGRTRITHTPKRKGDISKILQLLQDPIMNETKFQKYFFESVNKIKERKAARTNLPQLKKSEESQQEIPTHKISDGQLNDFDRRNIVQDFLTREDVRTYLFEQLFSQDPQQKIERAYGGTTTSHVFEKPFS